MVKKGKNAITQKHFVMRLVMMSAKRITDYTLDEIDSTTSEIDVYGITKLKLSLLAFKFEFIIVNKEIDEYN